MELILWGVGAIVVIGAMLCIVSKSNRRRTNNKPIKELIKPRYESKLGVDYEKFFADNMRGKTQPKNSEAGRNAAIRGIANVAESISKEDTK